MCASRMENSFIKAFAFFAFKIFKKKAALLLRNTFPKNFQQKKNKPKILHARFVLLLSEF